MAAKCKYGRLKSPTRDKSGRKRVCKRAPKRRGKKRR